MGMLVCSACFEPREGCLDIAATNFDAAVDDNCCCTYPALKLTMLPRYDTLVWKPDTAYEYSPGQWFRLKEAVFYLAEFQLVQNGETFKTEDTLSLSVLSSMGDTVQQQFTNDFQLIRRTNVNYSVGTFQPSGTFESIGFTLGLGDDANRVLPALAPDGHPLAVQPEKLWLGTDTGFVALKLVFTRDTFSATVPDTLLFSRPDFDNSVIVKNGTFVHENGYDFSLEFTVNYREFFRGVDLSTGDISAWKAQIIGNLPEVFSVSQ